MSYKLNLGAFQTDEASSNYEQNLGADQTDAPPVYEALQGTVSAQAGTEADLYFGTPLAGTVSAVCSTTSNLKGTQKLSVTVDGVGGIEVNVRTSSFLAGIVFPVFTNVFGNVKTDADLSGLSISVADTSGRIKRDRYISGEVSASASLELDVRVGTWLEASSIPQSGATGNLKTTYGASGLISGECGVSPGTQGSITIATRLLSGLCEGVASCTGDVAGTQLIGGSVSCTASTEGHISKKTLVVGTSACVSSTIGNVKGTQKLAVGISPASQVTGSLTGTQVIGGTVASTCVTTGRINLDVKFDGLADGVSSVSGNLKKTQELTGSLAGECGVSPGTQGSLIVTPRFLSSTVNGESVVTGQLREVSILSGTVTAQSTTSGELQHSLKIVGTADGVASTSGDITSLKFISASSNGEGSVVGSIICPITFLSGIISGISTVKGTIPVRARSTVFVSPIGQSWSW
jgi:hypothetical protein